MLPPTTIASGEFVPNPARSGCTSGRDCRDHAEWPCWLAAMYQRSVGQAAAKRVKLTESLYKALRGDQRARMQNEQSVHLKTAAADGFE